jgi:hypothetical protein
MSIPEIPAAPLTAAMEAAWPGLPGGMSQQEAEHRTRLALNAAYPHLLAEQDDVLRAAAEKIRTDTTVMGEPGDQYALAYAALIDPDAR